MKQSGNSTLIDYSIFLAMRYLRYAHIENSFETEAASFSLSHLSIKEIKSALMHFNPNKDIQLTFEQKKILLLLIGLSLSQRNGTFAWQLANYFHHSPSKAMKFLGILLSPKNNLVNYRMIIFEEVDFSKYTMSVDDMVNLYQTQKIFVSPILLSDFFHQSTSSVLPGYPPLQLCYHYENLDFFLADLNALFKHIFFLTSFVKAVYSPSLTIDTDFYQNGEISKSLKKIKASLIKSKLQINLTSFISTHTLAGMNLLFLFYLIYKVLISREVSIDSLEEILNDISFNSLHVKQLLSCFSKDSVFIKEKLITQNDFFQEFNFGEVEEEEDHDNSDENDVEEIPFDFNSISISKEKLYQLVFNELSSSDKNNQSLSESSEKESSKQKKASTDSRRRSEGLYEIYTPKVTIKNVILDEAVKKELLGAVDLTKTVDTMKAWGVKPTLSSSSFNSIKILLHGVSGTGKTITAEALAGEAGADLYKVDAANLVTSWVGESAKNVKKVFKEFYKVSREKEKRVFMFFNEADQLLSSRGSVMQAADKEYNQMQNILLEELESLDGVFIATTNLIELFDSAWNRRFNIKIRFEIPSYETRLRLWKVHISDRMPISPDVNFKKLAEYELAGGSVANVVYNAARKAALREGELKIVTQKDFLDAIKSEIQTRLGGHKNNKLGFSS